MRSKKKKPNDVETMTNRGCKMPFTPFFGNLIGFGAGRKSTLVIDYLKVVYL